MLIERGDDELLRFFMIRDYPSLDDAVAAAKRWRDETHLEKYGTPVTDAVFQLKRRRQRAEQLDPATGLPLPQLPPGLSYGFHRGRLLYLVVSHQVEGRPTRTRVPILDGKIMEAISQAEAILAKYRMDAPMEAP